MPISFFKTGVFAKFWCIILVASSFMYGNVDDDFMKASTAFFDEGKVFSSESKRLMDNTHQVDKELLDFEHALMILHRTSQALKALDGALTATKEGLIVAEQIPQTREQAIKLKLDLEKIHKPVSNASKTMQDIDVKVVPLLNATHKAEVVASKLVIGEDAFRHVGISYINSVGLVSQCEHDGMIISILDHSRGVYTDIDREMKRINDIYDTVRSIPEKTMYAILKELEKIRLIEEPVMRLNANLEPLYDVLKELEHVLDKRIGVKPGYPCGVEICHKEQSYPCGTKTCTKHVLGKKVSYPCGVETCTEKVPYPCGDKTCHVDITMSVNDALKGADAIEHKIESMLSSTIFSALKTVGLGSIIHDLENEANNLVKPILSKLHLNIDTRLPSLDINLDPKLLEMGIADIGKFEAELEKLSAIIDMHSPTFAPSTQKLDKINEDIKSVLNSPRCKNIKR